jgi:hypothetical protein
MLFHAAIFLAVFTTAAVAEAPSAYQCAPGKPVKGGDCSCPSGHRAKRDFDNVATCIALPTPSVSARFVKAVEAGNLAAARDLARKYDLHADRAAGDALGKQFKKWSEGLFDKLELLASRGQCGAIETLLAPRRDYEAIVRAFAERYVASRPEENAEGMVQARMSTAFKPLDEQAEKCIAVASRDDGAPAIAREYRKHHRELAACLSGDSTPLKISVVVDAEGKVVRAAVLDNPAPEPAKESGKPKDVSKKTSDRKEGTYRMEKPKPRDDDEEDGQPMDLSEGKMGRKDSDRAEGTYRMTNVRARNECIEKAVRTWSFKPNARGFSATPIIAGPGTWPTSTPGE